MGIFIFGIMKRLSSYLGLYFNVLGFPIFFIAIIATVSTIAREALAPASVFLAIVILVWLFTFRRWKGVYYKDGAIYIYDVFSNTPTVIEKDNIGEIIKPFGFGPNYYKLLYYDENKDAKYVWFQRNFWLDDFKDIISKINGVN